MMQGPNVALEQDTCAKPTIVLRLFQNWYQRALMPKRAFEVAIMKKKQRLIWYKQMTGSGSTFGYAIHKMAADWKSLRKKKELDGFSSLDQSFKQPSWSGYDRLSLTDSAKVWRWIKTQNLLTLIPVNAIFLGNEHPFVSYPWVLRISITVHPLIRQVDQSQLTVVDNPGV